MKLSKSQVDALAQKIRSEIIKKKKDSIKNDKRIQKIVEQYNKDIKGINSAISTLKNEESKTIKELNSRLKTKFYYGNPIEMKEVVDKLCGDVVSLETINQEIVLQTINFSENENIDEFVENLVKKFDV